MTEKTEEVLLNSQLQIGLVGYNEIFHQKTEDKKLELIRKCLTVYAGPMMYFYLALMLAEVYDEKSESKYHSFVQKAVVHNEMRSDLLFFCAMPDKFEISSKGVSGFYHMFQHCFNNLEKTLKYGDFLMGNKALNIGFGHIALLLRILSYDHISILEKLSVEQKQAMKNRLSILPDYLNAAEHFVPLFDED